MFEVKWKDGNRIYFENMLTKNGANDYAEMLRNRGITEITITEF